MPGFFVENFGCRATQADGAALERQFEEQGLTRASSPKQASVVILNTCTVTTGADQDARAAIRRVKRQNPDARIVVTGCYAQRAPEEISALPGVDLVIGNSHKHQLAEIAMKGAEIVSVPETGFVPLTGLAGSLKSEVRGPIFVSDIFAHTELLAAPVFDAANERTRPNLKIQDGCDNRCSFCVIPYVRGQSRSLETSRIIGEVNTLVNAGYREAVISGINLGRWGRDLGVGLQASGFSQTEDTESPHVGTAAPGGPGEQSSPAHSSPTSRKPEKTRCRARTASARRRGHAHDQAILPRSATLRSTTPTQLRCRPESAAGRKRPSPRQTLTGRS